MGSFSAQEQHVSILHTKHVPGKVYSGYFDISKTIHRMYGVFVQVGSAAYRTSYFLIPLFLHKTGYYITVK